MFTADRRRVVMFLPFFPKLIAARACTPHFAEYGPRPCVTTLPYGSRPWNHVRQPLAHPGNRRPSGVVREGSLGTETRPVRADPGCRSPSLFLRRRVWAQGLEPLQRMSPERREWGSAHAAKDANLFASSSPSRRAHVSNDRRPGQGRWPATSAQSVTKISSSDSRDPPCALACRGIR